MNITFKPKGVCARKMEVETENGIIVSVNISGGCSGNLQGISKLVEGMEVKTAIEKMRGIRCGFKSTSCPDQLSIALEQSLEGEK